jgi:hypothetical protein
MRLTTRSVLTGALLLSAAVLEAQQTPGSQFPQQAPPAAQQPAPASQFSEQPPPATMQKDVAAVVNGDPVTNTEVKLRLQSQIQGQQVDPQTVEKLREKTLNSLIESRLVEQYVTKKGPAVKSEEVETVLTRFKQQLAAQQTDYNQYLASQGHNEAAFKKRIKGSLAWRKYQQQALSAENLQKYYEQNRDQFQETQSFEEAQPQVAQAYVTALWQQIVSERKPEAKIEVVKPQAPAAPPAGQPAFPGSNP